MCRMFSFIAHVFGKSSALVSLLGVFGFKFQMLSDAKLDAKYACVDNDGGFGNCTVNDNHIADMNVIVPEVNGVRWAD